MPSSPPWFTYIVECHDHTYYTGITNNLAKRLLTHNTGKGAAYTRGRGPVKLVYSEACADRSSASKREAAIKKLSRPEKIALCDKTK